MVHYTNTSNKTSIYFCVELACVKWKFLFSPVFHIYCTEQSGKHCQIYFIFMSSNAIRFVVHSAVYSSQSHTVTPSGDECLLMLAVACKTWLLAKTWFWSGIVHSIVLMHQVNLSCVVEFIMLEGNVQGNTVS